MKAIIAFLRYPAPGRVKTRLASSVGNEEAAAIYKEMAETVVATIRQAQGTNILFFIDSNRFVTECGAWLGTKDLRVQTGRDIGVRMANAFTIAFEEGNEQVLLLGTDIPSLTIAILDKAFAELAAHDSVLGRTVDGGYYLIGLKSSADFLFTNMTWSANTVFSITHSRIVSRNMTCGLLPVLRDIDTLEDFEHEGFGNHSGPE